MKPKNIGVFEAKTRLSEILEKVQRGQVYLISRRGRPVAELRPIGQPALLTFGCDARRVVVAEDFDAPVPGMQEYVE